MLTFVRLVGAAVCAGALIAPGIALGQFPEKAVTLIVPHPPGHATDAEARRLAAKLTERWGRAVLVDNKPGRTGIVGAEHVARAAADGYTLLMGDVGTQSINPSLYRNLPYDTERGFAPLSLVAELPLVLLVHPSVKARSARDLVALAKAKAGRLRYSSSGTGAVTHIAAALFESVARVRFAHVPRKEDGQAISDLIAGRVSLSFATALESLAHVGARKVRALAVTSAQRSPALPQVPTVAESGLPGYELAFWFGVLAPAEIPARLAEEISEDIRMAVTASDMRHALSRQGAVRLGSTPAELQSLIDRDRRRFARIVGALGVPPE